MCGIADVAEPELVHGSRSERLRIAQHQNLRARRIGGCICADIRSGYGGSGIRKWVVQGVVINVVVGRKHPVLRIGIQTKGALCRRGVFDRMRKW